jgi:hypothetical protein
VYSAAPRLEARLLRAIARLDDPSVPIAETYRRSREVADRFGTPRPSYERVRLHLKEARRRRRAQREKRDVLIGVATYTRPLEDLSKLID